MLLKRRFKRYEKFRLQQRERVSFCRVVVRQHLQIEHAARAVVESGDCGIKITAPANQARHERAVVGIPVLRRDLGVAAYDPTFQPWNLSAMPLSTTTTTGKSPVTSSRVGSFGSGWASNIRGRIVRMRGMGAMERTPMTRERASTSSTFRHSIS